VTINDVRIDGHSPVHNLEADCEMHLGAHSSAFSGDPDGLVLEPMNACIQPFPGKAEQSNADWTEFGDKIKGSTVIASGVPRIWPEHLHGGGAPHPAPAVEVHPPTGLVAAAQAHDFVKNIFAGEFRGGVSETTALAIVRNTSVSVTTEGDNVGLSFTAGTIGNFTVLEITLDAASVSSDGAGSFRMN